MSLRRAHLHDAPLVEHADPIGHGQRLDLVVRDEEGRIALSLLQVLQLHPQRLAQLGVQIRERLVHQEDPRVAHDRPADGHALHLAAGQACGLALQQMADAQHLGHLR